MKIYSLFLLLFISFGLFLTSCNDDDDDNDSGDNTITDYKTPKYIFFFIGDGMSTPQINATEAALNSDGFKLKSTKSIGVGELNIQKFEVTGMQTTYAEDRYITGSAASATALATGHKTTINTIGMNGDRTEDYKTMAEMAKEKGMKVGIISSVSIDHATPACFYAHTPDRNNYYSIGQDLAKSNFDYFAGGGVRWNKYDSDKEVTGLSEDINLFLNSVTQNGYTYVNTRAAFDALKPGDEKIIATLEKFKTSVSSNSAALPYTIDLDEETSENNKITLSEFTEKGIELLENEKGFFMMVEGGKIDWACHANDVVSASFNTVEFNKAIGKALNFYEKHPEETLIVVTGDHECGGLTLGFSATGYETAFSLLDNQKVSYESFTATVRSWNKNTKTFESALEDAKENFGLGNTSIDASLALTDYETKLLKDAFNKSLNGESAYSDEEIARIYGGYDPFTVSITHILNNKAGIDWTTYSHTGAPVPVFALGQGMYEFNGYYDNTDIAKKIMKIGKLSE
jgi:alkaline phosphatase